VNYALEVLPFLAFFAIVALLWLILVRIAPPLWRYTQRQGLTAARHLVANKRLSGFLGPVRERLQSRSAYLPVALILIVGAAVTLWSADGFLDLAELLRDNSPELTRIDREVHDGIVAYRSAGWTTFFETAADVGSPVGLGAIVLIVAVVLVVKRRFRWLLYLAVTAGGGGLLNLALKEYFARQRPDLTIALRGAHGYSFPSGHAMGSMIAFSALAYLAFRAFPTWNLKALAIAVAATSILSVSASRIYLGVHWTSDVGAGLAAGALWTATTTVAYELFRQIYHLRERMKAQVPPPA
jgi:undecaprenyl-diphosphatase